MIKNVFTKEEVKRTESNIDVRNDSREVIIVLGDSWKCDPIGVMTGPDEWLTFAIIGTWDFSNFGPRWFLDKNDVELGIRFKYRASNECILSNVLREDP